MIGMLLYKLSNNITNEFVKLQHSCRLSLISETTDSVQCY